MKDFLAEFDEAFFFWKMLKKQSIKKKYKDGGEIRNSIQQKVCS